MRRLGLAFAAAVMTASVFACGSEETVVRRETYTYMPAPQPTPVRQTVIEQRTYEVR
jgi:hypothetical protein